MTEQEVRELYEERLAIMLEGNSRDHFWLSETEIKKRFARLAYFDVKRAYAIRVMPKSTRPD